jgi:hypothetical protein
MKILLQPCYFNFTLPELLSEFTFFSKNSASCSLFYLAQEKLDLTGLWEEVR